MSGVEKEIKRLEKIFSEMPKEKLEASKSIIRQIAFMTDQLESLMQSIPKNGLVYEVPLASGGVRINPNPEVILYNKLLPNHLRAVKQLVDLLPPEKQKQVEDELTKFIKMN